MDSVIEDLPVTRDLVTLLDLRKVTRKVTLPSGIHAASITKPVRRWAPARAGFLARLA